MLLMFAFLLLSYQKGCLNDEGTYLVDIKIYADRNSRHVITNYIHHILPHAFTEHIEPSHTEFESAHLKHYFGAIFNAVNKTLKGTNIQFRADFSELFKHEYSELHERYCGYFSNITAITENFLNDFKDPHTLGDNKILLVDCRHNNAFLPTSSHMASKNRCGKVHGILLTDPEIMKHKIAEGLYRIFSTKSISQVQGINGAILADICQYVQFCNANFDKTGMFIKDLGMLTHKTLTDGGVKGYGYKIAGRFIRNFGHDFTRNIEYEDSQYNHHDHGFFHGDDGYYHRRHDVHDDDSCHRIDDHHYNHHGHRDDHESRLNEPNHYGHNDKHEVHKDEPHYGENHEQPANDRDTRRSSGIVVEHKELH